jgi:hypothetical protein
MTPQEKAIELYNKMYQTDGEAKQAAIICVEEIQKTKSVYHNDKEYDYWQDVKTELNKL